MSAVAELEAGLNGMLNLKPPGVSGSRIANITTLCLGNVQSESVLIQKIFTHFKKAPATHKLGVLYVVDSVTRKWLEQAKGQGQPISGAAQDGTYAAGVHRVTELMPTLMNDIICTAPEDQKEKIKKLIDIWEKGLTFPPAMLASFREKVNAAGAPKMSTTPPGSPPVGLLASGGSGGQATIPPAAMPNIMEALANIARQNTSTSQNSNGSSSTPAPAFGVSVPPPQNRPAMTVPFSVVPPTAVTMPPPMPGFPFMPPVQQNPVAAPRVPGPFPPNIMGALGALGMGVPSNQNMGNGFQANAPAANAAATQQQQLALITTLAAQGIPLDKITAILSQVMASNGGAPAAMPSQLPQPAQSGFVPPPMAGPGGWDASRTDQSRDRNSYQGAGRSPDRSHGRSRSRSPRNWDRSPHARNDRGFDHGSPQDRDRGRSNASDSYRQRSPAGRRRPSSPEREGPDIEKWIEHDHNLPAGSIKVYSRTLFVGGVTCSEAELRQLFSRFGQVQTCIVNRDKRHAFVKMYYRKDAQVAKEAMEIERSSEHQLRTRWGVGFGPRDCSDYQTGISIIPIHKLTDADKKWMLTAPYGGSGGRPIVTGMCVEEPDIEIGAGVSSKAISRRMQTDKGGNHGPKSSKRDDDFGVVGGGGGGGGGGGNVPVTGVNAAAVGGGRWRRGRGDRGSSVGDINRRADRHDKGVNEEPVVLGFPPGITMGPNGPNFAPDFSFGQ